MNDVAATTEPITNGVTFRPLGVVGGVDHPPLGELKDKSPTFTWRKERSARWNYLCLGRCLAAHCNDLFRNGTGGPGVLQVLADGTFRPIHTGAQLAPVLVDALRVRVKKDGKIVGDLPAAVHLNAMLKAECFLGQFLPVDRVSRLPMYQPDFVPAPPGRHQDSNGWWLFSVERDAVKGRERAMGLVLKKHIGETLEAATEACRYRMRLEGGYRRWDRGGRPHTRYVFTVLSETPVPAEA